MLHFSLYRAIIRYLSPMAWIKAAVRIECNIIMTTAIVRYNIGTFPEAGCGKVHYINS